MLNGKINSASNSKNLVPRIVYENVRLKVSFSGNYLKQDKVYNHGKIVNNYIVYEIISTSTSTNIFTLKNYLFGAVKITKNVDISKYKYSGNGIGFDSKGSFLDADNTYAVNVIIFGADLSSSIHTNIRTNNILVLGKDFIQGINGITIYAEQMYAPNFTASGKKVCLNLHYNGDNTDLFVNNKQIVRFKAADSEIIAQRLCLASISEGFGSSNITGLYVYVYDLGAELLAH